MDRLLNEAAHSSCSGPSTTSNSSSSSSIPLSQALANCPAWHHMPEVLATQPALFSQVASSLLHWWQLSGHPRLWQLLSATCRPAWRRLVPAAGASAATDWLPASCVPLLYCPGAPVELPQLLLQTPSRAALRQLLSVLPGLFDSSSGGGAGADADGEDAGMHEAAADQMHADVEAASDQHALSSSWPAEDEWGLAWDGDAPQHGQHATGSLQAAWRLVMQHRCWYEYATWLLAHSSLVLRFNAAGAGSQPQEAGAAAAATRKPQQTQQQQQQQQQQMPRPGGGRADALQDAAAAAAFVAWLAAPGCEDQQRVWVGQLLACATAAASAAPPPTDPSSSPEQAETVASEPQPLAAVADSLLASWQTASSSSSSIVAAWPWWLAGVDLPLALLRHPVLQLQGYGPVLLSAYQSAAAHHHPQQQQQQQVVGSVQQQPVPPEQQLLLSVKRGQAVDALESLSAAALEMIQTEVAQALGGKPGGVSSSGSTQVKRSTPPLTQQQPNEQQQQSKANKRSWLAACVRHVLVSGVLPLGDGNRAAEGGVGTQQQAQPCTQQKQPQRPTLVLRLRNLLTAVQSCHEALDR